MTDRDYQYAEFDAEPDPSHRPLYLAAALAHLRADAAIRTVIDVGCGGGDFAEGLALAGYQVFGVDLSPTGIAAAQRRNIGQFALHSVYDRLTEPFGVDCFDAAVCVETIEHLYSPRELVKRVYESLRPGGTFVVTSPYWGYLKNIALAVTNRTDRALTALWDGGHIKHFSRRTLTQLVCEPGFEFIEFHGCGVGIRALAPYLWPGMLIAFRKPL